MSPMSPLLFLHRETKKNGGNNLLLIYTYIPVISNTEFNFISNAGSA
jgi:hypothetical protein